MLDTQQVGDKAVASGLGLQAMAGINQNDRQIGGRGAGCHVTGVLLMPRRIGDDELALVSGEKAVSHIDGNALLTLRLQPVDQQRQIHGIARGTALLRIPRQCRQLIIKNHLGVVQQSANQGRLAIIHTATGDKAQQILVLMLVQILLDVVRD